LGLIPEYRKGKKSRKRKKSNCNVNSKKGSSESMKSTTVLQSSTEIAPGNVNFIFQ
jgi:hypothetical protein